MAEVSKERGKIQDEDVEETAGPTTNKDGGLLGPAEKEA